MRLTWWEGWVELGKRFYTCQEVGLGGGNEGDGQVYNVIPLH